MPRQSLLPDREELDKPPAAWIEPPRLAVGGFGTSRVHQVQNFCAYFAESANLIESLPRICLRRSLSEIGPDYETFDQELSYNRDGFARGDLVVRDNTTPDPSLSRHIGERRPHRWKAGLQRHLGGE